MEIYVATQSPKMRIIHVIVRQDTLKINKYREMRRYKLLNDIEEGANVNNQCHFVLVPFHVMYL